MRVAYVCADPGVPVFGRKGASVHVQEVVRALAARGLNLDLFAARLGNRGGAPELPAVVHEIAMPDADTPAAREGQLRELDGRMAQALRNAGSFDFIYERYALWSSAPMELARSCGIPGVLEVNAPLIEEQSRHRILLNREAAERATQRALAAATALLGVSREVADWLGTRPEARGKVHVVANGVDAVRFHPEVVPILPARGWFTVGFVGTLKPWHGVPRLVEALARLRPRHPKSRLLVVGDGPERARLEDDARARGLGDDVVFTGPVEPETVPGWIASMDAAVAPYPAGEAFYFSPLKLYEYMAGGRAVVASRIGQIEELLRDGHEALLCTPGDAGELTNALARLAESPTLRQSLGNAARARVLDGHTWDAVAGRILTAAFPEAVLGRA